MLVNVDINSSKPGWGDFCSSPRKQANMPIWCLKSDTSELWIQQQYCSAFYRCGNVRRRLVWKKKQMARLGLERTRQLYLCTACWYTCGALAAMTAPHSHSLWCWQGRVHLKDSKALKRQLRVLIKCYHGLLTQGFLGRCCSKLKAISSMVPC